MLVGIKNVSKLIGISIIACCAVLVCTMFLNFYFDIRLIESEITSELSMFFYNAQVSTAKVVCLVSGGCLLLTAIVMLLFYIKHYIDTHKKDLSSEMMGVMMLVIGLVLAFTTLFLAITTVINGNTKTIAMMRVFGYSQKECCRAILGGYRPLSYIGFIIGTVYQYGLLRLMVDIVFKDVEGVPTYKFDFPTMLISLACFITIYEIMMYIYSEKIKKISIKEIMIE